MSRPLSPLVSRLLAVAILFGLCAAVWMGVAQPVIDRFIQYRATVARAGEQLPRLRGLAAIAPALEAELARVERDPDARTRQLDGDSDALAAADLQNRLGRIATASGTQLRSTQILPPVDEEGFRRITVRVALECDAVALLRMLYEMETASTLLFVDNLEIRTRGGGRLRRSAERGDAAPDDLLMIRFDLAGYIGGTAP